MVRTMLVQASLTGQRLNSRFTYIQAWANSPHAATRLPDGAQVDSNRIKVHIRAGLRTTASVTRRSGAFGRPIRSSHRVPSYGPH